MLNKKKFLIISVLAIFIVAMSLSTVSASKTKSVTFKINKDFKNKNLKNGDRIEYAYEFRDGMQWGDKGVTIATFKYNSLDPAKHTKLKKATIWFKKTSKNKGKKKIKRSSSNTSYYFSDTIHINLVNGYKPYKLKVWYKNK